MACFERDLHTLISGGDHVVLALFFHVSIFIALESSHIDFPIICICYFILTFKIFLDVALLDKNISFN